MPGKGGRLDLTDENELTFDVTLKETERSFFCFKFIRKDAEGNFKDYEPDYANRLWTASDGGEISTHSHAAEITVAEPVKRTLRIAFALGGLAGNNAHGAGFLQAAIDAGVKPQMISCTSGQIFWTWRYLQARQTTRKDDALLRQLTDDIEKTAPFRSKDLDLIKLALFGKPGMMRLAWQEATFDLVLNGVQSLRRMVSNPSNVFFMRELLRTLPARQLVMEFGEKFFEEIAKTFNQCEDIGIAFNSYDPVAGMEHIHLNETAKKLLGRENQKHNKVRGERTKYRDITPHSVRDALWVFQYGFDDNKVIDGAYHRQIILDELMMANGRDEAHSDVLHVFIARPIQYCWKGPLPTSWPDLEDMKTEMAFDGSYRCEVDKVEIINKLIRRHMRISEAKRHKVPSGEAVPD